MDFDLPIGDDDDEDDFSKTNRARQASKEKRKKGDSSKKSEPEPVAMDAAGLGLGDEEDQFDNDLFDAPEEDEDEPVGHKVKQKVFSEKIFTEEEMEKCVAARSPVVGCAPSIGYAPARFWTLLPPRFLSSFMGAVETLDEPLALHLLTDHACRLGSGLPCMRTSCHTYRVYTRGQLCAHAAMSEAFRRLHTQNLLNLCAHTKSA
jgi:hypothetical protein